MEFLEDDKSQLSIFANTPTTTSRKDVDKVDPNNNRFVSSLLVLTTFGLSGIILNGLYLVSSGFITKIIYSIVLIIYSILFYEWDRIHGILTLSRKLRPVLNMASVFATYKHLDPDSALLHQADNYKFACCNVPELNSDLPRTSDESSPPHSPPKSSSTTNVSLSKQESGSPAAEGAILGPKKSESLTKMTPPSHGKKINLKFEDNSDREY